MNIRNSYTILLLICFLATGCRDEIPEPLPDPRERILFTPQISVTTRSGEKDAFETGDEFGVMGYCLAYTIGTTNTIDYSSGTSYWNTKKSNCAPLVFDKQRVRVTDIGCEYDGFNSAGTTGNNPKYWYSEGRGLDGNPNENIGSNADDYRYTFVAYYPYESWEINPSGTEPVPPVLTFTMPQDGTVLDEELVAADNVDAMLAAGYNITKSTGNVAFNFHHALTALGFEINNFSEYRLEIHSLKLRGSFFKKVSVDFKNSPVTFTFPQEYYKGSYVLFNSNIAGESIILDNTDQAASVTTADCNMLGGHILLISGEGSYFGNGSGEEVVQVIIDYTFNGNRNTAYLTRPSTFTPVPGVRYTAQLNFVGDAFVLQFVVDNSEIWEDGEMDDDNDSNDDVIFE